MSGTAQSEYERLRLSNIQRNEEYLQKLGFEKKQERVRSETKRKRLDGSKKELVEPTRRSTRVAILPPVSYREVNVLFAGFK